MNLIKRKLGGRITGKMSELINKIRNPNTILTKIIEGFPDWYDAYRSINSNEILKNELYKCLKESKFKNNNIQAK